MIDLLAPSKTEVVTTATSSSRPGSRSSSFSDLTALEAGGIDTSSARPYRGELRDDSDTELSTEYGDEQSAFGGSVLGGSALGGGSVVDGSGLGVAPGRRGNVRLFFSANIVCHTMCELASVYCVGRWMCTVDQVVVQQLQCAWYVK